MHRESKGYVAAALLASHLFFLSVCQSVCLSACRAQHSFNLTELTASAGSHFCLCSLPAERDPTSFIFVSLQLLADVFRI